MTAIWIRTVRRAGVVASGALVLASAACSSDNPTGVLGNGEFLYVCSGGSDTGCTSPDAQEDNLPAAIAVGATFELGYAPKSSSGGVIQGATGGYEIVPASPWLAAATGNTIAALREGYVALLARRVGNAEVEDFVHLRFSNIRSLAAQPAAVSVEAGGTQSVQLSAFDALGAPLAGRLGCNWVVASGASSLLLSGSSSGGSVVVAASAQPDVRGGVLHATCGAATVDVAVGITGVADGGFLEASAAADGSPAIDGSMFDAGVDGGSP